MGGNRALAVYRDNGHLYYLLVLTLRYFYRKQASLRLSEQAHGTQLALFLRLQRALYLGWPYLGRCPRLYTAAPTARAGCGDFSMKAKVVAFFPMAIAENEKTDL